MLLKKQQNSLFAILGNVGLPVQYFENENYEARHSVNYTGNDQNFSFEILQGGGTRYVVKMSPGVSSLNETYSNETYSSDIWEGIQDLFAQWAWSLKSEIEAPDLWAEAATTAQLFGTPGAPDEKFTDHELRELQSQLRTVEDKLAATSLPEAAIKELTAALHAAAPKAKQMTKKDWQNMVVGAVVGSLTKMALSADHVQAVYQILKATFSGWLLH